MHVELQATCSALGYQEGDTYIKEPDCLETVKDLLRFLKREDETCDIRRQLGHAQIVQNDLLPLIIQYKTETVLWEAAIRLLVNLSQPAVLCFNSHIPEDKTLRNCYLEIEADLQAYKEAFVSEDFFAVLTEKLGDLLKLDWEHRQEEDRLLIERLLILIRNILHIPPNPDSEQRTDDDASVHDQVLWAMHVSGLEDILLYIASSDEERQLCMHLLEIVSLMFREQSPDMLATAGVQRSETEKQKDERELEMLREQERLQKKANLLKFSTRHSRFGGTYVVKNMKSISERDLIYHKSQADQDKISLDVNKKRKKKAKNLQPILERELVRRSTLSIRLSLKEFCVQFLENCYNPLMYAVKDVLNREQSQEHDETYYLWAMRFFMEFCRLHSKQVDLISETMSVPTLHYIQVQLFQYYEMQSMEKKEAIVWGKRIHLALKAYQELLLTLESMDRSGNKQLSNSSKVIKSNIFYQMEFRDIFLTLLRRFEQKKQSRAYLKDLVETTHLFLKMLEQFSKGTKHLVVEKRKTMRRKNKKKKAVGGNAEEKQRELDDLWDEVSSELSAIFQGRSEIPDDVVPFDAASEVDIDQQRVDAMVRIQDALRNRRPGEGVAMFRAAREVWPEKNEFGTPDISPEDEFMALREVFMTDLPRPNADIPEFSEEQIEENEVEEEEMEAVVSAEQEFVFKDFVMKFTKPDIVKAFVLLLGDFQKNSTHTNHCCVKMLHRVAVDLHCVGMMFQASLFRIFQKILLSPLVKAERYKEIAKFSTYVVRKFVEAAEKNPKVFMELLFWKSSKESIELVDGYGTYQSKGKVLWTEDQEVELRRLFDEARDNDDGKDVVDCILERLTDPSKTRPQVIRELKRQELIESAKELKKPKGTVRAGPWREEQEMELHELFEKFKDSNDPVGNIISNMTTKRSKVKVMEKLLSLGLVADRKELYKKRGGARSRRNRNHSDDDDDMDMNEGLQELPSDYEEPDLKGSSSDEGSGKASSDTDGSGRDTAEGQGQTDETEGGLATTIINVIQKGYKDQLKWIQRNVHRVIEDREEESEPIGVPIVPLSEENETAMEDDLFLSFLRKIGLSPPANEQEAFWRIPGELTTAELKNIQEGLELDDNDQPIAAEKIVVKNKTKQRKKKKERKKKEKKEPKKRKNSSKFDALKELAKRKKDRDTKRSRRKPAAKSDDATGSDVLVDDTSERAADDTAPVTRTPPSKKKKRRVQKFVASDSESSDNERLIMATGISDTEAGPQLEETGTGSQAEASQPLRLDTDTDSDDNQAATGRQSRSQTGSQEGSASDDEPEIQSSKRSSSQISEDSDNTGEQPRKRSKLITSDSDSDDEPLSMAVDKKSQVKLTLDSDSDSEDDIPLAASKDGPAAATFPATLLTQDDDDDSDLDDHVPLRRVLQRKNMIESDDDD